MYFSTGIQLSEALAALPSEKVGSFIAFDPAFYAQTYMGAYQGTLSPLEHFVQIGADRFYSPNAKFDPTYYKNAFADLKNTNLNAADLLYHFMQYGLDEGRTPNAELATFNGAAYLVANPDVAAYVNANLAQFNNSVSNGALAHYVKFGAAEGRAAPGTSVSNGQTFTLTTGQDDLTGTAGSDTFKALIVENNLGDAAQTIQGFDTLNGGAGTDTLDATLLDNVVINSTSVEVISLRTGDAEDYTVGVAADVAKLNNNTLGALTIDGAVGLATINTGEFALTVNDMEATTVALNVDGADETTVTLNGTDAAQTLNLAFDGVLAVDSDATETLNVTVNGGGSFAGEDADYLYVVDGDGALTAATITGNGDLYFGIGEDGAALETLDASTLVGGVDAHLDNNNQVLATVKGGQGNDWFEFHGSLAADAAVTLGAGDDYLEVYGQAGSVTVDGGEGADEIYVEAIADETTTVTGGAGDDEIEVWSEGLLSDATVEIDAGAGDDSVDVSSNGLDEITAAHSIDGGDGTDEIRVDGQVLEAEDYIVLNELVQNFEEVRFTSNDTTVDASELAGYSKLTFETDYNTVEVTGVAADQAIVLNGEGADVVVEADGYDVDAEDFGGDLNITVDQMWDGDHNIAAYGDDVTLTVNADADNGYSASVYLSGDFQTATVTLNNAYDDADEPTDTAYAFVEFDSADAGNATDLTLQGDGYAYIYNTDETALAKVDASDLNSQEDDGEGALVAAYGMYYETFNASVAETVKLGDGIDEVWFSSNATDTFASTVAKMDTLTGLNLVADADDATLLDTDLSDAIGLYDYQASSSVTGFELFELSDASAGQSSLNVALLEVAASDSDYVVFEFKGNTYVYGDVEDVLVDTVTNNDLLIKLTGTYDTDLLLQAINVA
ncbi:MULTISPECIES: hypothetical protein [unclassified Acidovorax]|uniref:hypothetical protein n=1 Tax=unclassified Acidovorax TaxID=2684926 RepID=UPI000B3FC30D|nr:MULTISPECIES: hypothetical protein [unclassified Acidovorax]